MAKDVARFSHLSTSVSVPPVYESPLLPPCREHSRLGLQALYDGFAAHRSSDGGGDAPAQFYVQIIYFHCSTHLPQFPATYRKSQRRRPFLAAYSLIKPPHPQAGTVLIKQAWNFKLQAVQLHLLPECAYPFAGLQHHYQLGMFLRTLGLQIMSGFEILISILACPLKDGRLIPPTGRISVRHPSASMPAAS